MINHRLLKAIIKGETIARPRMKPPQMAERRRLNRMAERDVADWLYARFLNDKAGTDTLRGGDHRRQPRRDARASGGQWRGRFRPRSSMPCATNWCAARERYRADQR